MVMSYALYYFAAINNVWKYAEFQWCVDKYKSTNKNAVVNIVMSKNPFRICTFLCANEAYMSRYKSANEAYSSEIIKCLSLRECYFTLITNSNKLFLCWVNIMCRTLQPCG